MDAIKKKMQALKAEKDVAMDKLDVMEQSARDANSRAERAEEEVDNLKKRTKQIEEEYAATQATLETATQKLEAKEKELTNV
jgi:predicted  nucleic acid-binding Zn-ribbon protein